MLGKIKYIPAYVATQLVAENAAQWPGKADSILMLCVGHFAQLVVLLWTPHRLWLRSGHIAFPVCSAMGAASGDSLKAALSSTCCPSGSALKPRHFAQFSNAEGQVTKLTYVVIFCLCNK